MKGDLIEFDGERLTMADIMRRVPCMSRTAVRNALAGGRRTKMAMLTHEPRAQRRATRVQGLKFGKKGK